MFRVTNSIDFEDIGMDETHGSFAHEKEIKAIFSKMYVSRNC